MFTEESTMREIQNHPLLKDIAPMMVVNWDIETNYGHYDESLKEAYAKGGWNKDALLLGLNRLLKQRETGNCLYPIYSEEEIAEEAKKAEASLVWFPSEDPEAAERPYIIVVPGGGYVNVWNLTEGYSLAAHFNLDGYNAFILTYRVVGPALLPKPQDDFAQALRFIRDHQDLFGVQWDRYFATGFSAGAHLIAAWGTSNHGYSVYDMPKPLALFPIYPPVSWKVCLADGDHDGFAQSALGMTVKEAAESDWNLEEHVENYPPCYIVCTEDDELVNPEHSRVLKRALDAAGRPAVLEIGKRGGHGFAEGRDADTWGWMERALDFMNANLKES